MRPRGNQRTWQTGRHCVSRLLFSWESQSALVCHPWRDFRELLLWLSQVQLEYETLEMVHITLYNDTLLGWRQKDKRRVGDGDNRVGKLVAQEPSLFLVRGEYIAMQKEHIPAVQLSWRTTHHLQQPQQQRAGHRPLQIPVPGSQGSFQADICTCWPWINSQAHLEHRPQSSRSSVKRPVVELHRHFPFGDLKSKTQIRHWNPLKNHK